MAKLWLFLFVGSFCFATDILSIGIRTEFKYTDLDHQCYLPPVAENFTLAAELEENKITRATLRKNFLSGYSKIIELDSSEIAAIASLYKADHWVLAGWTVSGRVLEMLLWGGTEQGADTCFPPEKLETMAPKEFTYRFKENDSEKAVFTGKTKSGKAYRMELSLSQDF